MKAIIVTYNSRDHIAPCLRSLGPQPTVVIDNASGDGTVQLIASEFPDVEVVRLPSNRGLAAAINVGLRMTEPEDVLLLNPDVVVMPGALEHLRSYLATHPAVGMVAPLLLNPDGSPQDSLRGFPTPLSMAARRTVFGKTAVGRKVLTDHLLLDRNRSEPGPVDWALGAALLARRGAIQEIGGMDEGFFLYNEDIDWCVRMWKGGWEVHCCPEATMTHAHARTSRSTFALSRPETRHHWRSVLTLFLRHPALLSGYTARRVAGRASR